MKILKELVKRNVAGDVILIPVGETALDLKGLLTLNETAEEIWDLLPICETEEELVQAMQREYEVGEAELRADVAQFLARLRALSLLE